MAVKIGYFDRDGNSIPLAQWKTYRQDESYALVKQFDNGKVRVILEWMGRVPNPHASFPDTWPLFMLMVHNYASDGTLRADPVDDGKTFCNERAAVDFYTTFIAKWTESELEVDLETGEEVLVEVGNTLKPVEPPKPPDPNKPTTDTDDEVGAW
jgi:hypothetical protein